MKLSDSIPLSGTWNYPTSISAGRGRIAELPLLCRQLGIERPLLVTDLAIKDLPMTEQAMSICNDANIRCGLFFDIKSNPTAANVEEGVATLRDGNHDGVIAFGGGSSLDAAKAIALMAGQSLPLWAFEDIGDNWRQADINGIRPVIAVPTTAGTGSEVGRASVIVDEDSCSKKIIFHPRMLPSAVILDPDLTVGLPPEMTAATGMDALSHSLEAYCSPSYHPMADGIAIEACRIIKEHLPRAYHDGSDIEARTQMLVAASMGATAFQKGLGAMHALAHPIGALYDAHHGTLNAVLMPFVLPANRSAIEDRITRLARYLQLESPGFDSFLKWVLELRQELAIPNGLSALGINDSQAEKIGEMAINDPSAAGNPIAYSAAEYAEIFRRAVNGDTGA